MAALSRIFNLASFAALVGGSMIAINMIDGAAEQREMPKFDQPETRHIDAAEETPEKAPQEVDWRLLT